MFWTYITTKLLKNTALIKENRRVIGWDNAPHHVKVETYPHHFHDVDGTIKPSKLSGDPLKDLDTVINVIGRIILSTMRNEPKGTL